MSLQTALHVWDLLCRSLEHRMPERTFRDWISPCCPEACDGETLWVQVPSVSAKLWIEQQLAEEIHDALVHIEMPNIRIVFSFGEKANTTEEAIGTKETKDAKIAKAVKDAKASKHVGAPAESPKGKHPSSLPQGFESYTLENFVVGPNCEFAFSAAKGLVDNYGRTNMSFTMNPLFIYGGSGLGKTHLMVAIGKELALRHPDLGLAYLKAENFLHELTGAMRSNNTEPLRQKYQSKDVLLFDDIQSLHQNMVRTQEEIFYIFENMLQHGKHIVITSDKPPARLEGLHDRLKTRCNSGLTVDVYPPDFETRLAILKKKLEDPVFRDYPPIPEDVLAFIANKAKTSVRDLQGLLKRTIFQAGFLGIPVSIEIAQEAYRGMTGEEPESAVPIDRILKAVADSFNVSVGDLVKKKSRQQDILVPRQVAMYLARELTASSFAEIGHKFSNLHHSTVINSVESVKNRMKKNSDFNNIVQSLLNSIS